MMNRAQFKALARRMFTTTDIIRPCTLRRQETGDYVPGQPPTVTTKEDTGLILFTDEVLATRTAQGRETEEGEQGALAVGFDKMPPRNDDVLIVDGEDWRISTVEDTLMAGALYELVVAPQ